jgi:rubrerythrin
MSMISGLIDGLRERAKELRNLAPDPDVPYLVPSTKETMALAMRSAASEMEDAADTIWQLRDDLQRANAAVQDAEHDESMAWDRVRKAESENAKLRELVTDMWEGYNDPRCDECHLKDTPTCADCPICAREASVLDRLRELGVEVD